jgi:hypothetical protein
MAKPQPRLTSTIALTKVCGIGKMPWQARTVYPQQQTFCFYAIARGQGIKMPNFFGYILWAAVVLSLCHSLRCSRSCQYLPS